MVSEGPAWTEALAALRRGEVVAAATETFFGLLADARRPEAVERVLRLKGRAPGHPMALLAPDRASALAVARSVTPLARRWAERYWPGPLTLIFSARGHWHEALLGPSRTLGVRVPGPSPAARLLRAFGGLLTATSANRSGERPACTEHEVRMAFGSQLCVLPGRAPGGLPSTIVDVRALTPRVLRGGALDPNRLEGLVDPLPSG